MSSRPSHDHTGEAVWPEGKRKLGVRSCPMPMAEPTRRDDDDGQGCSDGGILLP
jgi:hypothetical protein